MPSKQVPSTGAPRHHHVAPPTHPEVLELAPTHPGAAHANKRTRTPTATRRQSSSPGVCICGSRIFASELPCLSCLVGRPVCVDEGLFLCHFFYLLSPISSSSSRLRFPGVLQLAADDVPPFFLLGKRSLLPVSSFFREVCFEQLFSLLLALPVDLDLLGVAGRLEEELLLASGRDEVQLWAARRRITGVGPPGSL